MSESDAGSAREPAPEPVPGAVPAPVAVPVPAPVAVPVPIAVPVSEQVQFCTRSADETKAVGRRLAALLEPGDVVILGGGLGVGKTTFTQGIGAGLQVRGQITSPTFVISRVHPAQRPGRPSLVHVDAYRLGGGVELDDLDVDAFVDDAVTVVEWGEGVAEPLSDARLQVHLSRGAAGSGDEPAAGGDDVGDARVITVTPVGARWVGVPLGSLLEDAR